MEAKRMSIPMTARVPEKMPVPLRASHLGFSGFMSLVLKGKKTLKLKLQANANRDSTLTLIQANENTILFLGIPKLLFSFNFTSLFNISSSCCK